MANVFNPQHIAHRHGDVTLDVSKKSSKVLINPKNDRQAHIYTEGGDTTIFILDCNGETVTAFKRKPSQGGLLGAILYLLRGGYQEQGE